MITLSASKIKTYQLCPRRYWYRYILNKEEPQTPYTILGSSVHKAIELGYQRQEEPTALFTEVWLEKIKEHQMTPEWKFYNDGFEMVRRYSFKTPPIVSEKEFRLPYPSDFPVCELHGFIDQIFEDGTLIDLKTSGKKPTKKQLADDVQFIIYAWAYEQLFGKKPTKVLWHHLRTGDMIEADVVDKDIFPLIMRILSYTEDMQYSRKITRLCDYCAFRKECLGDGDVSEDEVYFRRPHS